MNRFGAGLRAAALVLAVAPLFAACTSMLDDQTFGTKATPAGGARFANFAVIGTSISAGLQSGGINDSTQREGYAYQLALAMGLTPGANWYYPSFRMPGCPAPWTNALTGARVGGAPNPPLPGSCLTRDGASLRSSMNNVGIPGLRAYQALKVDSVNPAWAATDVISLATFITGGFNPVSMVLRQQPTFVIVEVGANDVLGASTRGDTLLLTPASAFTASVTAIADSLDSLNPKPDVAIMGVPNVTVIAHFTKASTLFGIKATICPQAGNPYCSPLFTVDASCAPNALGGIGDSYLLPFATTGAITSTLGASRAAKIDCLRDSALVAVAATPLVATAPAGATINATEYATITGRVVALNAAISTLATARGYAYMDASAALAAQAANIPPVPSFGTPTQLFGTLFSQDGVHPTKAGHRIIAQAFAAAINAKFGTTLVVP